MQTDLSFGREYTAAIEAKQVGEYFENQENNYENILVVVHVVVDRRDIFIVNGRFFSAYKVLASIIIIIIIINILYLMLMSLSLKQLVFQSCEEKRLSVKHGS